MENLDEYDIKIKFLNLCSVHYITKYILEYNMSWFGKKEKQKFMEDAIPSLPELPKLPEFPGRNFREFENRNQQQLQLPHLPSYPSNQFGEKFSQNVIKDAVTGEEKGDEEVSDGEEPSEEFSPRPLVKRPMTREISNFKEMPVHHERRMPGISPRVQKSEPVFIRMDQFEESLQIFEKARNKIEDMEKMLRDIKRIRLEEEKELHEWENEIQNIKGQFERIDRDIFSKLY